jgi:tetratricopeptide (TPR) repeat protein
MRLLMTLAVSALCLAAVAGLARAEQIRLADGRYLQGDVVEVKEDGFTFKLTDTGGKVFLRWGQVDAALKKRLTNDRDPDEGLTLQVSVPGARLELIDGTVYEGQITESNNAYRVLNRDNPRGRSIAAADVIEEGFVPDIMIDATIMHTEKEVLKLAEDERAPLETAIQYYELARIADSLGLYREAKDYVTLALGASPDTKLDARLTEYDTQLDELIRQEGLLNALVEARQLAKRKKFQAALDKLNAAKEEFEPKDAVLTKWQSTLDEIDLDFSRFVITDWYKQIRPATRRKVKENSVTIAECIAWTRRELDNAICAGVARSVTDYEDDVYEFVEGRMTPAEALEFQRKANEEPTLADQAEKLRAVVQDIRERFPKRFELEIQGKIRLSMRKASFGQDGFYGIVGDHLPVAGKKPQQDQPAPPGSGPRNPRRDPRGNRDREGSVDYMDADAIARLLNGQDAGDPASGGQDISHLKVPNTVPTLQEWWDAAGSSTKGKWLEAYYARYAGTMRVFELDDWEVKYK